MNKGESDINYPKEVMFSINDSNIQDYIHAANQINKMNDVKLVNIQHEYGIFGGKEGDFLLTFLKKIKKTVIVTFHTVVDEPSAHRKKITQEIAKHSSAIIVIIKKAKEVLQKEYGIDGKRVFVVPHGIHKVPFKRPPKTKKFFGTKDKIVLSTFGLLGGKSKGLEHVIEALPRVIRKNPNVIYAILGTLHPDVLKTPDKVKKWNELKLKIKHLGLENHVRFYNTYLSLDDLLTALQETDIYLTPYISKDRKSSGTLAYALGCGRVCICTPFYFAEDMITNNENGIIVDFNNPKAFADAINHILENPDLKAKIEKRAYDDTRNTTWGNVANSYYQIQKSVVIV